MTDFFLSERARVQIQNTLRNRSSLSGKPEDLREHLKSQGVAQTIVFADYNKIDAALQMMLADAQMNYGSQVSIFPWHEQYSEKLLQKLTAGISPSAWDDYAGVGVYDGELPPGLPSARMETWTESLSGGTAHT